MLKINKSHLNNEVMLKILKACRVALDNNDINGGVFNKKGELFLVVKKVVNFGKVSFIVTDKNGKNIRRAIGQKFVIPSNFCGGNFEFITSRLTFANS